MWNDKGLRAKALRAWTDIDTRIAIAKKKLLTIDETHRRKVEDRHFAAYLYYIGHTRIRVAR